MPPDLHQLAREVAEITGAAPPAAMEDGAPVLAPAAMAEQDGGLYLIGLIGGKDVGKSALVNALVGQSITRQTSFGAGTEAAIAYVHESAAGELRELLEREIPGQYEIITHTVPRLSHQVLLDLPDIDSHYAAHVQVTRRILRHMLYPIWVQSVEKYADQQPQRLLAAVAEGNDARNFLFCLNKVDQIVARDGEPAARELQEDFAGRLARTLKLGQRPRVWLVSALHPERFDFPILRQQLSQQKERETIAQSKQWAARQQAASLLAWIDQQQLPRRLEQVERLEEEAGEEISQRIGAPLLEDAIPQLLDDSALTGSLADELLQKRVARWPGVNLVNTLLSPFIWLARRGASPTPPAGLEATEALVDSHLRTMPATANSSDESATIGPSIAARVQATFAHLQRSHPQLAPLYRGRKLWETIAAESAEAELRRSLAGTIERQRAMMRQKLEGGRCIVAAFFRLLLTIGALLWFPIVQPIVETVLSGEHTSPLLLAVRIFGVTSLLKSVSFLALYFLVLWLILRWSTQQRVARWISAWKEGENLDPAVSPAGQVLQWTSALLDPIRRAKAQFGELVRQSEELRQTLEAKDAA